MIKNRSSDRAGKMSSEDCYRPSPELRIWSIPFSNPNERIEILEKVSTSSQFGMRYRGLFEFYGDDLITYKREKPKCPLRNKFLQILSSYFTDYLEDDSPASWPGCQASFWEELIFVFFMLQIQVTNKEKEVETFLPELKKFTRWIDKRAGTNTHPLINKLIEKTKSELIICERLINHLYYKAYHELSKDYTDPQKEINSTHNQEYNEVKDTLFEISEINGEIAIASELFTNKKYLLNGLPNQMISPGTLIHGTIGKKYGHLVWNWLLPENVFPQRAKKYLMHFD
ncbi:hypothetical protein ACNQFZ_21035 [Schinkia sp. CFF1]